MSRTTRFWRGEAPAGSDILPMASAVYTRNSGGRLMVLEVYILCIPYTDSEGSSLHTYTIYLYLRRILEVRLYLHILLYKYTLHGFWRFCSTYFHLICTLHGPWRLVSVNILYVYLIQILNVGLKAQSGTKIQSGSSDQSALFFLQNDVSNIAYGLQNIRSLYCIFPRCPQNITHDLFALNKL